MASKSSAFSTLLSDDLNEKILTFSPKNYRNWRNYTEGPVSELGPYFTHGVLSPREFAEHLISREGIKACQTILSQLAWREYFQGIWEERGKDIFTDLKKAQHPVMSKGLPKAFINADSGIHVIDDAVIRLYKDGLMHNHARLWLASCICNMAKFHWLQPSKWLYYHLLDGDLASNSLSWQWVAGSFGHKKYLCNQDNINTYSRSIQRGTCIDTSYEDLHDITPPRNWVDEIDLKLVDQMPPELQSSSSFPSSALRPIALHSLWNLNPRWLADLNPERVLIIEPSNCEKFPMSKKRWQFIESLISSIPNLKVIYAEFDDIIFNERQECYVQSHPMTRSWACTQVARDKMFPEVTGYFPSFSKFWKKAQHYLPDLKPFEYC